MKNKVVNYKINELKVIYKRSLFTCLILFIYILGSNISIISTKNTYSYNDSFYRIAISNVGGDINTLNIFTLGLGPWLTSMIFLTLMSYKNVEKALTQTRLERNLKEKLLTLFLSVAQGYFVINQYVINSNIEINNIYLLLLIVVTGTMLLVWLADQNIRYGIAGPMPIVLMSIVKSLFKSDFFELQISLLTMILVIVVIVVVLFILLIIELTEYRIEYKDIMNFSNKNIKKYLSWKINPAGSFSIMISVSVFLILGNTINFAITLLQENKKETFEILTFNNVIGISIYVFLHILLSYFLSRFILNTKNKTSEFLKSGNYFVGINPGSETEIYLNKMAKRVCFLGTFFVTFIIAIPLYSTLLIPGLSQQIYFALQLIILVYIGINITETIRTYLYFDKYQSILNKYL